MLEHGSQGQNTIWWLDCQNFLIVTSQRQKSQNTKQWEIHVSWAWPDLWLWLSPGKDRKDDVFSAKVDRDTCTALQTKIGTLHSFRQWRTTGICRSFTERRPTVESTQLKGCLPWNFPQRHFGIVKLFTVCFDSKSARCLYTDCEWDVEVAWGSKQQQKKVKGKQTGHVLNPLV